MPSDLEFIGIFPLRFHWSVNNRSTTFNLSLESLSYVYNVIWRDSVKIHLNYTLDGEISKFYLNALRSNMI